MTPVLALDALEGICDVRGARRVDGSGQEPVELDGGGRSPRTPLVSIWWGGAATASINIVHANIHSFPRWSLSSPPAAGSN